MNDLNLIPDFDLRCSNESNDDKSKYVFAQLMSLVHPEEFDRCVEKYNGHRWLRNFSCWHQFLSLSFGQLTHQESLRDLVLCLQSHQLKLYHLGLSKGISRTILADANEQRDWRIYADLPQILIQRARFLYAGAVLEEVDLAIRCMLWIPRQLIYAWRYFDGPSFASTKQP